MKLHKTKAMCLAFAALAGCATVSPPSTQPAHANAEPAYRYAAVAADHPLASQAGLEMLQKGGNAVDAAVATSFCLSVVRPFSCGIGGGGFMVIYQPAKDGKPAKSIALNYRETCPAAVGPDFYPKLDDKDASKYGWRASGVPGTVAGLCQALKDYGTLDLKTALQPAIRAAEDGFEADASWVSATRAIGKTIAKHPEMREALGPIWTNICREGNLKVGDAIRNRDQARALRLIADQGAAAFYQGEIADAITASMREHDGTLTADGLRGYRPREVQPLHGSFRGAEVISMPPPSSGGIAMQQIFGILERRASGLDRSSHNSADYVHLVVEAMKHAFADRSRWLGDTDDMTSVAKKLLSPAYLDRLAAAIDMQRTREPRTYGTETLPEDHGTSHFCVLDRDGMAVACTETINLEFGSLVCVPGFGFCLNNEMDDFTTTPGKPNAFGLQQSEANLPAPGKRPLSSMSPTIVLHNGNVIIVAGASGGPRIITATTQCMLNVMLFHMTPTQAVRQPRFHHQWIPDKLLVDRSWTDQAVLDELKRRGHDIGALTDEATVQMIAVDEKDGTIRAASDPRKGGRPAGY